MNILIIGGNRFFGKSFLKKISVNKNYKIYVINRGNLNTLIKKNITHFKSDRNNFQFLNKKLEKINFDYIFDNCCYDLKTIKSFYKKIYKNKTHYVFASSSMVYMDNSFQNIIKEEELKKKNFYLQLKKQYKEYEINYAINKKEIEQYIVKNFKSYTILRIHNVIGSSDFKNITKNFINYNYRKNSFKNDRIQVCYDKDLIKILTKIIFLNLKGKNIFNVACKPILIRDFYNLRNDLLDNKRIRLNKKIEFPLPINHLMNNSKIANKLKIKFTGYKKIILDLLKIL